MCTYNVSILPEGIWVPMLVVTEGKLLDTTGNIWIAEETPCAPGLNVQCIKRVGETILFDRIHKHTETCTQALYFIDDTIMTSSRRMLKCAHWLNHNNLYKYYKLCKERVKLTCFFNIILSYEPYY